MAEVIDNIAKNLSEILNNIEGIIVDAAERNEEELADIQTDQMQKGKNADGGNIGRLRNPSYAQRKKNRGGAAPIGVVDLRNTGRFQKGVFATVTANGVLLDSKDSKKQELTEKYGKEIFGYNDESIETVKTLLVPTVLFQIKRDILN